MTNLDGDRLRYTHIMFHSETFVSCLIFIQDNVYNTCRLIVKRLTSYIECSFLARPYLTSLFYVHSLYREIIFPVFLYIFRILIWNSVYFLSRKFQSDIKTSKAEVLILQLIIYALTFVRQGLKSKVEFSFRQISKRCFWQKIVETERERDKKVEFKCLTCRAELRHYYRCLN
jgi:hypothetical protein